MNILDASENYLGLESKFSGIESSSIAIVSAPYEYTVSYGGGTEKGPNGILEASQYVEFYDDEFDNELCFQEGICTLEALNFEDIHGKAVLDKIENQVNELLALNKFVVTLGGEHTISTAPINAHFNKYPNMSILHFDAHSDLRDEYEGTKYSHASIMARVMEFFPAKKLTQVGIRAQCIEEANYIKENGVNTFYASAIRRGLHGENWQKSVVESLAEQIYITFDVDYFDPSIMPSTGTPEPDGMLFNETLEVFREIQKAGKQIIGLDVNELAPVEGVTHPDILTAKLIYKILNFAFDA